MKFRTIPLSARMGKWSLTVGNLSQAAAESHLKSLQVDLAQTVFLVAFVWALPSMIVVVGAVQAGTPLLATLLAVALSAARLMPMTMALMPVLRTEKTPKWVLYGLSHFVAITAWVFGMTRLPELPRAARVPYFTGFASTLTVVNMGVAAASWWAAATLPPIAASIGPARVSR